MVCGFLPFEDSTTLGLYTKILSGTFQIPDFMSSKCSDLLKQILTINPEQRITIGQIKKHPWFQIAQIEDIPKWYIKGQTKFPFEEEVLSFLEENYSLNIDELRQDLINNVANKQTTLYYLLQQKFLLEQSKKGQSQTHWKKGFLGFLKKNFEKPTSRTNKTQNQFEYVAALSLQKAPTKYQNKSVNNQVQEKLTNQSLTEKKDTLKYNNYFQGPNELISNGINDQNKSSNKEEQNKTLEDSYQKQQMNQKLQKIVPLQIEKPRGQSFCLNKKNFTTKQLGKQKNGIQFSNILCEQKNSSEFQNQEQLSLMIYQQQQQYQLSQQQKTQLFKIAEFQKKKQPEYLNVTKIGQQNNQEQVENQLYSIITNRMNNNRHIQKNNYMKSERLSHEPSIENSKQKLVNSNKNITIRKSKTKLIAEPKKTFIRSANSNQPYFNQTSYNERIKKSKLSNDKFFQLKPHFANLSVNPQQIMNKRNHSFRINQNSSLTKRKLSFNSMQTNKIAAEASNLDEKDRTNPHGNLIINNKIKIKQYKQAGYICKKINVFINFVQEPKHKYLEINHASISKDKINQQNMQQYAQQIIGQLHSIKENQKKLSISKGGQSSSLNNKKQIFIANNKQKYAFKAKDSSVNKQQEQQQQIVNTSQNENENNSQRKMIIKPTTKYNLKNQIQSRENFLKQVLQQQIIQINNNIVINKNSKKATNHNNNNL